ncbi:hypothetical protein DI272_43700 [Streptomyces sp. Act143]|uniref:hypothetical protein n=1 Tax=Streptomyces sp. Act143 TaxID=2200760 RepID=UPI000D67BC58|nr:hypothetical protein [Streptomyces sp. Act143]PWI12695.1 hypothetical protein DI272_43700 [Streptomyces sp. Act143]
MKADTSPQSPGPALRLLLEEAVRDCAPPAFPQERIVRRAAAVRRRRRLATVCVAALLMTPVAGELAFDQDSPSSHAVSGADRPTLRLSAEPGTADAPSPVRVVRPWERIDVGFGVWYFLKEREFCAKHPIEKKPGCVGPLDVEQPGAEPATLNWYPFPQGVVTVFAYTGKTPAERITMTQHGRTTVLPIVRLAGRPSYVSSYAVSAPAGDKDRAGRVVRPPDGPVFRVYGADGEELAEMEE